MKKTPDPAKRRHVHLNLPDADMRKLEAVQKLMRADDQYEGAIGNQSAIRYAIDKVAGEATGG